MRCGIFCPSPPKGGMTMFTDNQKQILVRVLAGGILGVAAYLLLAWVTQPGSLFGAPLTFDFTFCYNSRIPEVLGAALGLLLWFLFGAEIGIATLPFADEGKALLLRSLCHFGVMTATMWAWILLNFTPEPLPGLILSFQLPFTLIYVLIWLGRWVGWYAEVAQIRERLGLSPAPSALKWRESLPHIAFSSLLCFLVPTILRLCDAAEPVLSGLLYPYLLLPIGGFCSGCSLGKRQGFCPLYPLACAGFVTLFALTARLYSHMADGSMVIAALLFPLLGNLLGAGMRALRKGARRETL